MGNREESYSGSCSRPLQRVARRQDQSHLDFRRKAESRHRRICAARFSFEVTGIVETGMYEYDNAYVFIALDKAQDFAALGDGVTGIEVKTNDRWQASGVAER
jgi:ABC-type lipoprotein release transport system permease subunit